MRDMAVRVYITVHMNPITLPGGVYVGFAIVWYQESMPFDVKILPASAIHM
jgi:hypothetical protein